MKGEMSNLVATRSELMVRRNIVAEDLAAVEGEV
jgi:hypothetical protein